MRYALPTSLQSAQAGVSFICVVLVLFPLMVPGTFRRTLLTNLLSALMEPLSLLALVGLGVAEAPTMKLAVLYSLPTFLCGFLGLFPAFVIQQPPRAPTPPPKMGAYQLEERLGEGGMGEVWRASHRMLARPAAVKLIKAEAMGQPVAGQRAIERFAREARATAGLHSPHTIQLYDFGTDRDGNFFYVMELLDGLDLQSMVERFGALPPARVVYILKQVCDSLEDAHRSGLIHRDIKPANIYLCRYGHRHDFVKVLDFGLVKHQTEVEGEEGLTRDGAVPGTPAYMPPEMAIRADEVDARSDLYALGCVAYWLLTGQRVFPVGVPTKVIIDHVRTPPEPPSSRVETPIPEALEALVMQMLEKQQGDRPANAAEVRSMLERVEPQAAWDLHRAERWWKAHLPEIAEPAVRV